MNTLARANVRNTVLVAIALLAIAAAVWRLAFSRGHEGIAPTDPSSWTNYVCEGCGAFFHLTGREVEEALANNDVGSSGMGDTLTFRCKECGELKAVRAEKCPQHDVVIKLSPGPDEPRACPECGFRP